MPLLKIREVDGAGRQKSLYVANGTDTIIDRVDTIKTRDRAALAQRLLAIFLPTGFPNTVSPDYTAYHIYNALQAFSSSIAGLLASRAVLQGLGVGDKNASATNAMLLNVLQESMGRVATIFFAHQVGSAIEAECKMYRLLADILNDIAMVSDCLSPLLPKVIRVLLLGASSIFRALCGVASGSSKATLGAHFARGGNIGELNAKDASQETIISLLGMWVGGVIVSYATSTAATWIWLILLLVAHLSTNYLAVRAVCVHSINKQRASLIFSSLMDQGPPLRPDEVANRENIFHKGSNLRWNGLRVMGTCEMGVPLAELLRHIGRIDSRTKSVLALQVSIQDILDVFAQEQYLLWIDAANRRAVVVFIDGATVQSQLKAWAHALRAIRKLEVTGVNTASAVDVLELMRSIQQEHIAVFDNWIKEIEAAGWDIHTSAMETTRTNRILLEQL